MNLDSWTPQDKARRVALLLASYLAVIAGLAFWLGLHWAWYMALLAGLVLWGVAFVLSYAILRQTF